MAALNFRCLCVLFDGKIKHYFYASFFQAKRRKKMHVPLWRGRRGRRVTLRIEQPQNGRPQIKIDEKNFNHSLHFSFNLAGARSVQL